MMENVPENLLGEDESLPGEVVAEEAASGVEEQLIRKSSNKLIIVLLVLVVVLIIALTVAFFMINRDEKTEDEMIVTPVCSESCDDSDACTTDICTEATNYECLNEPIVPCCGNAQCEEGEDFLVCSSDCELSLEPLTAVHAIIPSGQKVVETVDVLSHVIRAEQNYLDSTLFDVIPRIHSSSLFSHTYNSHDYVDISFSIPDAAIENTKGKQVFFEMKSGCRDYGEIFIKVINPLGEMDTYGSIKCEKKVWEEKQTTTALGIQGKTIKVRLQKDGGEGQTKIDFVRLYIK